MLGSVIGGALSAAGSIFGGISASKAMKKVKKNIEGQMRDNEAWYDRRDNEDATQHADAQAALTTLEERLKQRNKAAAGAQAVMGGTEESVAAEKEANAQALANTTAQIAAAGQAQKNAVEQQYLNQKSSLNQALNNAEMNKAQQISNAVQGVAQAGGQIASAFDPQPVSAAGGN